MPQTRTVAEPKPPFAKAGEGLGHVEKFSAEPGSDQNVTGQDKKRHGCQRKSINAGKEFLAYEAERQVPGHNKHGDGRSADSSPDRYGQRDQCHEDQDR